MYNYDQIYWGYLIHLILKENDKYAAKRPFSVPRAIELLYPYNDRILPFTASFYSSYLPIYCPPLFNVSFHLLAPLFIVPLHQTMTLYLPIRFP